MGRRYTVPFSATAVTAAVDAFEVLAATAKPFILREIVLGQSSDYGDAQAEGLSILIKRATGSYTSGSGGSTVTPTHNTNTPAAGPTPEVCNTTQAAAGSGTLTTIRAEAFNVQSGYQFLPTPEQAEGAYLFLAGEACVVSITAPADSITVSGTLEFEEL
jgi:hypothetical protein